MKATVKTKKVHGVTKCVVLQLDWHDSFVLVDALDLIISAAQQSLPNEDLKNCPVGQLKEFLQSKLLSNFGEFKIEEDDLI